tara:strand:+ start:10936 stop:11175 length:240 start_codon:yes stop_codon:yes gene_type:complete
MPIQVRLDTGPELIPTTLIDWCETNNIELVYIQPSKPRQNRLVRRRLDYNEKQTHESLGNLAAEAYRAKLENPSLALCH